MEPGEALSTASQLAMALAGFAGVVVAFRSGALHQWAPIDKLRLRLLLGNSVVPLLACLVGMLLLSVKPPPIWIWRACSGLALAFAVSFGISTMKGMRAIRSAEWGIAGTWRFLFYGMGILAIGATLLQVYNVVALNAFWAFFATIVVQLVAGIIQFARLILLPLHETSARVHTGNDAGDPPLT
jgi:hypothetical protein